MTTELIDAPTKTAVAEYEPFYSQLAELEKKNTTLVFNYEDKKGNKEARSHINTLRLTKGALERTRKEAKSESLRIGRAVDSEAGEIGIRIEAMIAVHQVPLDAIEKREEARIGALKEKIAHLGIVHHDKNSSEYRFHIETLESVVIDDKWQEFIAEAAQVKDASIAKHRELLAARIKSDTEAAELEKLRKESAARAQKDRDDALIKAAEDRARSEAEALAEAQQKKAAKAIADAEARSKQEREDGERRELSLKLEMETANRRRVESEQKAAQDAIDAADRAEKLRLKAVQDEKDRAVAEVKAEADATAKREANKAHLRKINIAAFAAFVAGGMTDECAKLAVTLIAKNMIPAVSISY
ncbi:hypothetical protein [Glaciimonas sp. PCH181]|uniref:hypothetical protein n=1 Tax=Glaciimonas sp. PCH181 TaxID=2133943 RepID=UPI000D35AF17|nr:hypothetical protein [Glaciimonas sp. PCH181]PUA19617.1 hypothetical protein C7W93_07165 [Glaciimonas sp. PCH181]